MLHTEIKPINNESSKNKYDTPLACPEGVNQIFVYIVYMDTVSRFISSGRLRGGLISLHEN